MDLEIGIALRLIPWITLMSFSEFGKSPQKHLGKRPETDPRNRLRGGGVGGRTQPPSANRKQAHHPAGLNQKLAKSRISKSNGIVLQCRLHRKLAQQADSKDIACSHYSLILCSYIPVYVLTTATCSHWLHIVYNLRNGHRMPTPIL